MKKTILGIVAAAVAICAFASCVRVSDNYNGDLKDAGAVTQASGNSMKNACGDSISGRSSETAVNITEAPEYPDGITVSKYKGRVDSQKPSFVLPADNYALSIENNVNNTADSILECIISDSMKERDKAWAIYSWVTENLKYSNSTSYLTGRFYEGANSGFTVRRGNCYIYYAVTRVLLTRAGIENMEIQRNDPDNPHYWNLVKVDGCWYHIDTCPHYAGHRITAFLLTDADLKRYSETEVKGYYDFDRSKYPVTPQ